MGGEGGGAVGRDVSQNIRKLFLFIVSQGGKKNKEKKNVDTSELLRLRGKQRALRLCQLDFLLPPVVTCERSEEHIFFFKKMLEKIMAKVLSSSELHKHGDFIACWHL